MHLAYETGVVTALPAITGLRCKNRTCATWSQTTGDAISLIGEKSFRTGSASDFNRQGAVLLPVQRGVLIAVKIVFWFMVISHGPHALWQVPMQVFPVAMQQVVDQQHNTYQDYDTTAQQDCTYQKRCGTFYSHVSSFS